MSTKAKRTRVGSLRPSALIHSFGIGSVVDLPRLSTMVMGLDDWPIHYSSEINEERLLASVQNALGGQVKMLLTPPRAEETAGTPNAFDATNVCRSSPDVNASMSARSPERCAMIRISICE